MYMDSKTKWNREKQAKTCQTAERKKDMRRRILALLLCLVMAGSLGSIRASAAGSYEGAIRLEAERKGQQLLVTVSGDGVTMNAMQFLVAYDKGQLAPSNYENNTAASSVRHMTRYIETLYDGEDNPGGWLVSNASLDSDKGQVEYVLSVAPESAGRGSDAEGYVRLSKQDLLVMSFQIQSGVTLGEDCLRVGSSPSVPEGAVIAAKEGGEEAELSGRELVAIDLSKVASGGSGSGDGSGSGSGSGGNEGGSGAGTPGDKPNGSGTGGFGGPSEPETTGPAEEETPAGKAAFSDLEGHWAKTSIEKLVKRQVLSGYADGTFRPEAGLTRGEFAAALQKAMGLPAGAGETFSDCRGHWASAAVNACYEAGYVSGTGAGRFSPDQGITREELTTILAKVRGLTPESSAAFTDRAAMADWSVGCIGAAAKAGLVSGYADGSFRPGAAVNRAEMAQMIVNLLEQ